MFALAVASVALAVWAAGPSAAAARQPAVEQYVLTLPGVERVEAPAPAPPQREEQLQRGVSAERASGAPLLAELTATPLAAAGIVSAPLMLIGLLLRRRRS